MTSAIIHELPLRLEPVTSDPFIADLAGLRDAPPDRRVAAPPPGGTERLQTGTA